MGLASVSGASCRLRVQGAAAHRWQVAAFALPLLLTTPHVVLAGAAVTRADYERCQAGDEKAFTEAIEAITIKALEAGTKDIDYRTAVSREWVRLGVDGIIDRRVDLAVGEVRDETGWGALIGSLANKEKAQDLATAVAERVYKSEAVSGAIEGLANGVGQEIGQRIETATLDAAEPAIECLKTFLGAKYGASVAAAVTGTAGSEFGLTPEGGTAEISTDTVLKRSGEGLTGAALVIMRRQLGNIAGRIGQRLAGSIVSRLVSVVAGGVGLVLIAKDLWDLRHGVLPIISEEMKSNETKGKVQDELALALSESIHEHVREIGSKSAGRLVEIWREFKRAHAKAIELAERDQGFRSLLDSVAPASLPRLDEVIAMLLGSEGEAGILKRTADGSLAEAVNVMSEDAMTIARDTGSIDRALGWSRIAGGAVGSVVAYDIHKRADPSAFSKGTLEVLFALDDRLAIQRLAGLDRAARETLLDVGSAAVKPLARSLSESELSALAFYLTGLSQEPRARVLEAISAHPGTMQRLTSERVRTAIVTSRDQTAAVEMMLRPGGPLEIEAAMRDAEAAWQGRIAPVLIWERHPGLVIAAGLAALILLLLMKRMLRPPQRPSAAPQST